MHGDGFPRSRNSPLPYAFLPRLEQPGFENLPAVFRILRPAVEKAGISTQAELQACLVALENVSATETLVFLRGILATFKGSAWTLTYLRLTSPAAPVEILPPPAEPPVEANA